MTKNIFVHKNDIIFDMAVTYVQSAIAYILDIEFDKDHRGCFQIEDKYEIILFNTFLSMRDSDFTENEIRQISDKILLDASSYFDLENEEE
jgi:hypothetical protein